MSAVSIPSRKMPWQTKAQHGTVMAALAIKKEIVKARLLQIREDVGHPDKPGKPLTVEDAAAKAGVKYRTWQRWEAGESIPYARNLSAIADAFGFDVGEFYDDSGDKAPTPSPFAGSDALADRLDHIERAIEALRQERMTESAAVRKLLEDQDALLQRQSGLLEKIEAAVQRDADEAQAVKDETDELRRLAREMIPGRVEAASSSSPQAPQPPATAESPAATGQRTR